VAGTLLTDSAVLERQPSHTLRRVRLHDPATGAPVDEALVAVMRAPRSYTGEDVVELSCHGSPAALAMVTERLRRAGARLAEPGEFTRRAFVNGRLDLARAEAVALLIGARSERAVTLAARALAGGLGERVNLVRDELIDLIAGLEVSLDFPDDGVGLGMAAARTRAEALGSRVATLLGAARRGRVVHEGMTVAIVGRPNAGKSSLLNALLGSERAIVAPTPGTTRDVVEGTLVIAGVPVRLLDTAGLAVPADAVEAEGMRRTQGAVEASDLVLWVVDGSVPDPAGTAEVPGVGARPVLVVRSKSDLPRHPDARDAGPAVSMSTVTGDGIPQLLARLADEVAGLAGADGEEGQIAASVRQVDALETILESLRAARDSMDGLPLEATLQDLREALTGASRVLGMEVGDAVLERVFSTFCVGK
jgi:tRNA modification GTPase